MQGTDSYVRSSSVVARTIGGETLIVPVRRGVGDLASIYSLNEIGTLTWEAMKEPTGLDSLIRQVVTTYEVTPERARQDLTQFLSELETVGLIAKVSVPALPDNVEA